MSTNNQPHELLAEAPIEVIDAFTKRKETARIIAKSSIAAALKLSVWDVFAIMEMAAELHIPEVQALLTINMIKGRPAISPQLMLSLAIRTGQLENWSIDGDDQQATVKVKRKGWDEHTQIFTVEQAQKLGLLERDNWNKQRANMLKWRCIAAALRVTFPDAMLGMYTPEELNPDLQLNDEGEIVHIDPPSPEPENQAAAADAQPSDDNQAAAAVVDEHYAYPSNQSENNASDEDHHAEFKKRVGRSVDFEIILDNLEMTEAQFFATHMTWEAACKAVLDLMIAQELAVFPHRATLRTKSNDPNKLQVEWNFGFGKVTAYALSPYESAGYPVKSWGAGVHEVPADWNMGLILKRTKSGALSVSEIIPYLDSETISVPQE